MYIPWTNVLCGQLLDYNTERGRNLRARDTELISFLDMPKEEHANGTKDLFSTPTRAPRSQQDWTWLSLRETRLRNGTDVDSLGTTPSAPRIYTVSLASFGIASTSLKLLADWQDPQLLLRRRSF
jgi:hypothetical protein